MAEEKIKNLTSKQSGFDAGQIRRPPVVVVLGHIDHGKSSLLQSIKELGVKITEKESGGITQHIGAYQIEKEGKKITFIDTPGHEAFSAVRSRGAKVADIAILVVDGSEGVKSQTKEAVSHAKLAEIPIIVAINKIDKPEADSGKVKRELAKEGVTVESVGGKVPSVEVSAKTGQGIEELLELVLLMAEMENLKTNIQKAGEGVVIESYLDNQKGPLATLILNEGKLGSGDIVGTLSTFGKIRGLENFQGKPVQSAFPSDPVLVLGLENVPKVGENFKVFPDMESARKYLKPSEKKELPPILEVGPEQKILNIILKADVLGSVEAIEEVLKGLPQEKVILRILKSEVGNIQESDVKLAKSGRAIILGFRVKVNSVARNLSEREKIRIMIFDVIYDLVEGIREFMEKIMKPERTREDLGKVKILTIFLTEKNRIILGGRVIEGEARKGALIEVFRDEELIGKGKLINLQRNKKDAERVQKGEECGVLFEGDVKIEEGDVLLFYSEERKKGEL